jgi:hypothetical protein
MFAVEIVVLQVPFAEALYMLAEPPVLTLRSTLSGTNPVVGVKTKLEIPARVELAAGVVSEPGVRESTPT